jgi:uncharacterized protein YcbK (DUF882 family)
MIDWTRIRHFKPSEFVKPELLRAELIDKLDELREQFGRPLVITSSWRNREHNVQVGGAKDSAHMSDPGDGLYSGVDIARPGGALNGYDFYTLLRIALELRFPRIGVYPKHLHLDIESRLPLYVVWSGQD